MAPARPSISPEASTAQRNGPVFDERAVNDVLGCLVYKGQPQSFRAVPKLGGYIRHSDRHCEDVGSTVPFLNSYQLYDCRLTTQQRPNIILRPFLGTSAPLPGTSLFPYRHF